MAYVTRKMLESLGACKDQLDLFERTWPEGGEDTRENLRIMAAAGGDVRWYALKSLTEIAREAYKLRVGVANARFVAVESGYADIRREIVNKATIRLKLAEAQYTAGGLTLRQIQTIRQAYRDAVTAAETAYQTAIAEVSARLKLELADALDDARATLAAPTLIRGE